MGRVNNYRCDGGNRTLRWSQFCDGIVDCHDRFDEEGHFCKLCVNNLYSCSPKDEIRCDLACKMLHYVPCQTIQDRRACNHIRQNYDDNYLFHLFKEFQIYIVATLVILLITVGIFIFIKSFIRMHHRRKTQSTKLCEDSKHANESDTLSSHTYEQCYEPPAYDVVRENSLAKTYYEHVV